MVGHTVDASFTARQSLRSRQILESLATLRSSSTAVGIHYCTTATDNKQRINKLINRQINLQKSHIPFCRVFVQLVFEIRSWCIN